MTGRLPCPFCDRAFLNADTVIAHCKRSHDPRLDSATAVYGSVCPACGQTSQRLSYHASRTHGRQLAALYADVKAAGDPHGVVADRLRLYAQQWLARQLPAGPPTVPETGGTHDQYLTDAFIAETFN